MKAFAALLLSSSLFSSLAVADGLGEFNVSGDLRARTSTVDERVDGQPVRGKNTEYDRNSFSSELNLMIDYTTENSWVSTKFRLPELNDVKSDPTERLKVDKVIVGFDLFDGEKTKVFVEGGRTCFGSIFDSCLAFSSRFDGIHLSVAQNLASIGEFRTHGGPFIVKRENHHYGWVAETGLSKIAQTGLYCKYSFVDWRKHKIGAENKPKNRYQVSQALIGYGFDPTPALLNRPLTLYAAALTNHAAQASETTAGIRANHAWYTGFSLGKTRKANDWSLDFNWQSVGALSVPESDLSGFGHGNACGEYFCDAVATNCNAKLAHGATNYQGFELKVCYALTDNLILHCRGRRTTRLRQDIGQEFLMRSGEVGVVCKF